MLCTLFISKLHKQFSDLSFLEDEHFDDGSVLRKPFIDKLVSNFEGDGVIDADEEHSGGLLVLWLFIFIKFIERPLHNQLQQINIKNEYLQHC